MQSRDRAEQSTGLIRWKRQHTKSKAYSLPHNNQNQNRDKEPATKDKEPATKDGTQQNQMEQKRQQTQTE